ncbi:phosphoenolpyruvate synthase [Actinomadura macrotermitis]|uniref:Prodigiosin synthesizing transferase PigC n=1 Tax=Actinomadura macrotermitis TaxID=2585200 RepID=A0A7K0BV20_9ACTN|nr:phosphoenolpyruvate synthase [Actinomadura macrotermitis]MQY05038.1 Prodigiosin synthesizing transferase PigC [Actinomadura macrotermitis]
MKVLTQDSPAAELAALGGGKARGLHALARTGASVPAWAVVGTDVFERYLADNDLTGKLADLVARTGELGTETVAARAEKLLLGGDLGDEVAGMVGEAYRTVGQGAVAVRSSSAEEDSADLSFAGQFATFLNVRGEEAVAEHVRRCWASAYSARALAYRAQHPEAGGLAPMAVIVQRMVRADTSGVLFTANPTTGDRGELIVSAVYGLGEALVSGTVDADTIVVDRVTGAVTSTVVGDKAERYDADEELGYRVSEVDPAKRGACCLTSEQIGELTALGARLEEAFGAPQDVEWAISEGRLLVLQSRPITTELGPPPDEPVLIWDNSNIVENFGGITKPLTFSFAQHVYHLSHQEYCRMLGVPERRLAEMDDWQRGRLGYFHGRVYYNLLTWYRMQRLLPFARMKRRVMELSMGVREPIPHATVEALQPFTTDSQLESALIRARAGAVFSWHLLATERYVRRFLRDFRTEFRRFDELDYEAMPGEEVYRRFVDLDRTLLPKWAPMIGLEAVILTTYGALFGLTRRWLPDAPGWFYWKVANPGGGVESAEPAHELTELAATVRADPGLGKLLDSTPADEVLEALDRDGHDDFARRVRRYIDRYGYRSLNELKLEEPDLRQNPASLFIMLRSALAATAVPAEPGRVDDVEAYLNEHLDPARGRLYGVVRRKVRGSLDARERVRFCRTRAFGLARRMFRGMGRSLAEMGALEHRDDIFYLRMEEIRDCFEGALGHGDLTGLVELRKRQEARDAELTPPERFVTRGPVYWRGNLDRAGWSTAADDTSSGRTRFQGTPCGPGVVEDVAQVVTEPTEVTGGVLVTYRTDPGWVGVLPSLSGLLIERGSPLTHLAIVARELGIPTVVQIKNITREVKTGTRLRVDGGTGEVTVVE